MSEPTIEGVPRCRVCASPELDEQHDRTLGTITWRCRACGHGDGRGYVAPRTQRQLRRLTVSRERSAAAERREQILTLWRSGTCTRREIADALDLDYSTVARVLRRYA